MSDPADRDPYREHIKPGNLTPEYVTWNRRPDSFAYFLARLLIFTVLGVLVIAGVIALGHFFLA
jgi:hypothetical protein